jgi:hypothetical protein
MSMSLIRICAKSARHHIRLSYRRFALLLMMIGVAVSPSAAKHKDDVVIMNNGDRFTGEIKNLQHGELSFKSAYMADSVSLDWTRVDRLESKDMFIVTLSDGRRYAGHIAKNEGNASKNTTFQIVSTTANIEVSQSEVIDLLPQESSVWKQLTGSINYGFSFTGDNSRTTSSLSANVAYNSSARVMQLSTSSQFNSQSTGSSTFRCTFTSQYAKKLSQRWFYAALFDLLKSDQQELNLRTTYGGGFGKFLVQSDKTSLLALGGLVYTHERYFSELGIEPVRNNGESIFGLQFSTFRFRTLHVSSQTNFFPSLTNAGRVRISSQSDVSIELVRNFNWDFGVYENFDSRPPINAPRNDLGITTSLGWRF